MLPWVINKIRIIPPQEAADSWNREKNSYRSFLRAKPGPRIDSSLSVTCEDLNWQNFSEVRNLWTHAVLLSLGSFERCNQCKMKWLSPSITRLQNSTLTAISHTSFFPHLVRKWILSRLKEGSWLEFPPRNLCKIWSLSVPGPCISPWGQREWC